MSLCFGELALDLRGHEGILMEKLGKTWKTKNSHESHGKAMTSIKNIQKRPRTKCFAKLSAPESRRATDDMAMLPRFSKFVSCAKEVRIREAPLSPLPWQLCRSRLEAG